MTSADRTKIGRRTALGAALAAAVLAIGLGGATTALADPVNLAVVDRDAGGTLGLWSYGARQFVAGRPGARYALRLSNTTPNRVLVVLSVDGVNVLTGETANYNQQGYILRPYESYEVSGWRKSQTTIAAFTFTALSNSYAARTGRPSDVGVIGMAVFNERPQPVAAVSAPPPVFITREVPRPTSTDIGGQGARSSLVLQDGQRLAAPSGAGRGGGSVPPPPPPAPMNAPVVPAAPPPANSVASVGTTIAGVRNVGSPIQTRTREDMLRSGYTDLSSSLNTLPRVSESLGTGHGALETSVITMYAFERATASPFLIRQIEYDSYANLVARGVIPLPPPPPPAQPRPFPGASFVPDPPRY